MEQDWIKGNFSPDDMARKAGLACGTQISKVLNERDSYYSTACYTHHCVGWTADGIQEVFIYQSIHSPDTDFNAVKLINWKVLL